MARSFHRLVLCEVSQIQGLKDLFVWVMISPGTVRSDNREIASQQERNLARSPRPAIRQPSHSRGAALMSRHHSQCGRRAVASVTFPCSVCAPPLSSQLQECQMTHAATGPNSSGRDLPDPFWTPHSSALSTAAQEEVMTLLASTSAGRGKWLIEVFGPEQRGRAGETELTALLLCLPLLIEHCTGACSWTRYNYTCVKPPPRNVQFPQHRSKATLPLFPNAELILLADTKWLAVHFRTALPTAELR